ncbi:MAG: prepilin-type N-terminal cleavage/methylation domain-containing protein [Burkholderiales bacterium]|nr:MAG: prepilin-type N-terminal cleavage/methylation domain-containing protein [Burkholderiales bacterium]
MLAEVTEMRAMTTCLSRLRGITLIELMVAVAVLGVLLAVAAPSLSDLLERRRVAAVADELAGVLTYAKAETNATNSQLFVRFDPDPNQSMSCAAVVTTSGLNRCRCYLSPTSVCPRTSSELLRLFQLPRDHVRFSASATNWAGSPNYIIFEREQMGIQTQGFQLNVVGMRRGYALRVEVNTAGRVKICSPNGDMTGYATCV